jgi:hypothetical protein
MTKTEKQFIERIGKFVFETPRIVNGVKFMDVDTFNLLSKETQDKFLTLTLTKTR